MTPPASSGPILVDVVSASGEPVPMARVTLASAPAPVPDIAALTGDDGRAVIGTAGPGAYTVAVHADGFAPARATVRVGSREAQLMFRLEPG